ncbi:MAG: MFS transporter [Chloroflexi bacterium]|nr:MFS transporter [Chloroflexota bacterium]
MTDTVADGKLTKKTKFIYGIGDVGNAIVNSAIQFYLLVFFTDGALIAPALAGTALWVAKFWDAINDPLFGWLSDRTTSRFGKRRVYMIFGALPLAISVALLWIVPNDFSDTGVFLWIVGTFILFDTMWTLTNVPYYALTAELTEDYDERASLTTFRMMLGVPAFVVGAALTPVLVDLFATKRAGFGAIGIIYGALAAIALWVAAAGLRERKKISERKAEAPPWKTFLDTFKNRPFVRLLGAYLLANTSFALITKMLYYFLAYQLDMEDEMFLVMGVMLLFVALFLFPWKMLAERWNKGPAYAVGLAIGGLAMAASFLLPAGPTPWIYVLAAVAGIGFSANWVFPWAMVPDVVEYDSLETGEHRGGMYYGVWGLAVKVSEALAIVVSGWVLQLSGYVANAAQDSQALLGIRLFFGPVPLVFFALALPLLIGYPITRASHAEMRKKLKAMEA